MSIFSYVYGPLLILASLGHCSGLSPIDDATRKSRSPLSDFYCDPLVHSNVRSCIYTLIATTSFGSRANRPHQKICSGRRRRSGEHICPFRLDWKYYFCPFRLIHMTISGWNNVAMFLCANIRSEMRHLTTSSESNLLHNLNLHRLHVHPFYASFRAILCMHACQFERNICACVPMSNWPFGVYTYYGIYSSIRVRYQIITFLLAWLNRCKIICTLQFHD